MSIDWEKGSWRAESGGPEPDWRLTITGDWAPCNGYDELMLAEPEGIYGDLLEILRKSDLRIVNVETVLGDRGQAVPKDGPNLRAPAGCVESLKTVPFHIACLANNHCLDYGPEGLEHTLWLLREAGMVTVGGGLNDQEAHRPLVHEFKGAKIAILNGAEGEESSSIEGSPGACVFEVHEFEGRIAQLRSQADIVLVIYHGGRERSPMPPPYMVKELRRMAEAGADAVIAHHAHVPQGIEIHHGVPIVYSLGNFQFKQETDKFFSRAGYLLHLDVAGKKLAGFEISPYVVRSEGLAAMKGELLAAHLKQLQHVSELLADPANVVAAWDAFIDHFGGPAGWIDKLGEFVETFRSDPSRGACLMWNHFWAPAHRQLFLRALDRAARNIPDTTPKWAKDLVDCWQTLPYEEMVGEPA